MHLISPTPRVRDIPLVAHNLVTEIELLTVDETGTNDGLAELNGSLVGRVRLETPQVTGSEGWVAQSKVASLPVSRFDPPLTIWRHIAGSSVITCIDTFFTSFHGPHQRDLSRHLGNRNTLNINVNIDNSTVSIIIRITFLSVSLWTSSSCIGSNGRHLP